MMSTGKSVAFLAAVALFFATLHLIPSSNNGTETTESNLGFSYEFMDQWRAFKVTYGKSYSTFDEEIFRIKVFYENLQYIQDNQGDTYSLAINSFADLTNEEFKAQYLGFTSTKKHSNTVSLSSLTPGSVNWVTKQKTPPVQNQGQCGSCWAFSATEAIEAAYAVQKSEDVQLSEEQMVQCSTKNYGCNGGLMDYAFEYVQQNPLNTASAYPYTSGNGATGKCNQQLQSQGTYGITGYVDVNENDCADLESAIQIQPVAVAVDASNWSYYKSGIFNNCGTSLNHGVLAVGYYIDSSTNSYWIVQNSWGTSWGESGFIRLSASGTANTCGICMESSYPTV